MLFLWFLPLAATSGEKTPQLLFYKVLSDKCAIQSCWEIRGIALFIPAGKSSLLKFLQKTPLPSQRCFLTAQKPSSTQGRGQKQCFCQTSCLFFLIGDPKWSYLRVMFRAMWNVSCYAFQCHYCWCLAVRSQIST